jgi:hypothetical protein
MTSERLSVNWTVEPRPHLRGYTVEWAEEGHHYLSRRNVLYHSRDLEPPFTKLVAIPAPAWKQAVCRSRLAQRLLRFLVTNVIRLANGDLFVTFDKSVGIVRNGKYTELAGLARPCRVLRAACAIDNHGDVYFGEYLMNDDRTAVRVYRYRPGNSGLEVAYTFPAGSIKHIHGIYFDRFTASLLCLTGDDNSECRMLRTDDGFRTVRVVGEGDETWRAVSVLFDEASMFYGMDAEFRSNHIYRLDRRTSERTSLAEVQGTVYYSKQFGKELFFTTTAENGSNRRARAAAIWNVSAGGKCIEIAKFEKDSWHGTLFKFGTIHFPYANLRADALYFSVIGVKEDNQTFRIRRNPLGTGTKSTT